MTAETAIASTSTVPTPSPGRDAPWKPPAGSTPNPAGGVAVLHREASDERLMQLVRDRDTGAFAALYDRHSAAGFGLALRIVRAPGTAEDVLQEAFLSLWRAAHRYRPERGSVRTFLLGIVHNRAIDALRREAVAHRGRTSDEGIEEILPATERTDAQVATREEARLVHSALDALPERQGRAIELAFFAGLSHRQIAAALDEPLGTVKGRIRLGLERLRDELAPLEPA